MGEPLKFEKEILVELTVFTRKRRRVWNLPLTPGRSVLQYFRYSLSVWAAEHKKGVLNGKFYGYERGIFHAEQDR